MSQVSTFSVTEEWITDCSTRFAETAVDVPLQLNEDENKNVQQKRTHHCIRAQKNI